MFLIKMSHEINEMLSTGQDFLLHYLRFVLSQFCLNKQSQAFLFSMYSSVGIALHTHTHIRIRTRSSIIYQVIACLFAGLVAWAFYSRLIVLLLLLYNILPLNLPCSIWFRCRSYSANPITVENVYCEWRRVCSAVDTIKKRIPF